MVAESKRLTAAEMVIAAKEAHKAGKVSVADLSEFDSDGFKLIPEKGKLIGKGFTVMSAEKQMHKSNKFEEYGITAVTDDGVAIRFWDGSTGIYNQLEAYKGEYPFHVPRGLRVSEYPNRNGQGMSRTFYFDTDV